MEVIENTLPVELTEMLDRPLFCFLSTISEADEPRVSPLWYLWEDDQIWIIADTIEKSYSNRVAQHSETAIAIVDLDVRSGLVQHVGMRGEATIVDLDTDRVYRLLKRYLGPDTDDWDPGFHDLDPDQWGLIRFTPQTVVARDQSFAASFD